MTVEPSSLRVLGDLRPYRQSLPRAEFVERFRWPVLVQQAGEESGERGPVADVTATLSPGRVNLIQLGLSQGLSTPIQPVAGRRPGAERISVGRGEESDIVLRSSAVSRVHAYFSCRGTSYSVTDAGSRNGTFVNGERIEPEVSFPLDDWHLVSFGEALRFTFYTPTSLYALLGLLPLE